MKTTIMMSTMLVLSVLFSGCPYESAVPIDQPNVPIDQRIIGKWRTDDGKETYTVTKKDEHTYTIDGEKEKSKTDHFTGYLSKLNGVSFLNLSGVTKDGEKAKYLFYKIEIPDDNTLKIFPVTENVREKFTSAEELKKFFSENMKNSYFFEREGTLTRLAK